MGASLSINIKDLINTIFKKWYILAICVLLCTVAMLFYGKNLEKKMNEVIVASPVEAVSDEELEYINKIIEMEKVEQEMRDKVNPSDLSGYEEYTEYKDAVDKMKKEFTVKQSQAYDVIAHNVTQTSSVSQQTVSMKKYVVLGVLLGAVIGCGLVALAYMFTTKLRTGKDLYEAFGLLNIKDEDMLKTVLEKRNISKVAVLGSASTELVGIESASIENAEAAVFVEKIGVSKYKDIQSHYEKCALLQVPVIGYLLK